MKARLLFCALLLSVLASAQTYTESVLYSFSGSADGVNPAGGLVMDSAGNLYGTTTPNSANYGGVIFKIDSGGNFTILHTFAGSFTDGVHPRASLTIDKSGTLYGTTADGGSTGFGTAFKLTSGGTYSILHNFGVVTNEGDGNYPDGPVTLDSAGNLYGTTSAGGSATHSCGTVFKLTAKGALTTLHKFAGGSKDGCGPTANVMRDGLGNIYGTTQSGGANGSGVMFKLTSKNVESIMYNFCPDAAICDSGATPTYIARNSQGNFYGNVQAVQVQDGGDGGGIFELTTKGVESLTYTFCGSCFNGFPAPNGDAPRGPILISGGNFYGTTEVGGAFSTESTSGGGIVYELTPGGLETVLYSFPNLGSTIDGCEPVGGVVMDKAGNLYGTTLGCGTYGYGTVFKLTKNNN